MSKRHGRAATRTAVFVLLSAATGMAISAAFDPLFALPLAAFAGVMWGIAQSRRERRRHAAPTDDPPPAPRNARLIRDDGSVVPLDCRYRGRTEQDTHEWVAYAPGGSRPDVTRVVSMRIDMLPPRTRIVLHPYREVSDE